MLVLARGIARQVLQFCEGLDPRVTPTHEDERKGAPPNSLIAGGLGRIHSGEHLVPQVNGLRYGLEADGMLGKARDGEGARHRP
jgi:hypothetical protein